MSYDDIQEGFFDIIIIGAGAAGIIAAGIASQQGKEVLILEKMKSPGRKILISGKGRCNITNDSYSSHHIKKVHPRGRFLKTAYKEFFKEDILKILKNQGVPYKTERGDRIFPMSDKSKDVVNALIHWAFKKNTTLKTNADVKRIITENGSAKGVEFKQFGKTMRVYGKAIILATGGKSYPATGSSGDGYNLTKALGHTIIQPLPALVTLDTEGNLAAKLMGLSLKNANASLWVNGKKVAEEFGEMIFTHFGLSGPIILTLSRRAVLALNQNSLVEISIDLKPALEVEKLDRRLLRDLNDNGKKQIYNLLKMWMPSKLIEPMMELCHIDKDKKAHQITSEERKKIKMNLKELKFKIINSRSFKEAIITQGGISLDEIESRTMESKIVKDLFFAGEVVDLDADTGGYNFQIAYSTGNLAAINASKK